MNSSGNKYDISYALNGNDIMRILNGNTNIIEYSDLYNVDRIEDVMVNDTVVILYRSSEDTAHWCCLFINQDNNPEFFDPYGLVIDSEIDRIKDMNPIYADNYYHNEKRLIELLLKGNYKQIEYNEHKLQQMKNTINDCGRHVAMRLLFKDYSLEDYVKLLTENLKGRTYDELIVDATNKLI
jgi:hypothetical protein